jgi:hypothetical protein
MSSHSPKQPSGQAAQREEKGGKQTDRLGQATRAPDSLRGARSIDRSGSGRWRRSACAGEREVGPG